MVRVKTLGLVKGYTKILDLNRADLCTVTCSIASHVDVNCVAILLTVTRVSGTGYLNVYPDSGADYAQFSTARNAELICITNQELKVAQSVASDDWDIYIWGYINEGVVDRD